MVAHPVDAAHGLRQIATVVGWICAGLGLRCVWGWFCQAAFRRRRAHLWREVDQLLDNYSTASHRCTWAALYQPRAYPVVRREFDRLGDEYRGLRAYLDETRDPPPAARLAYATDRELQRERQRRRRWTRRVARALVRLERRLP